MNEEIDTPGVPELNEGWIARANPAPPGRGGNALTSSSAEIVVTERRRRSGGRDGTLVGILGPWASPAFAGWSADPTTPSYESTRCRRDGLLQPGSEPGQRFQFARLGNACADRVERRTRSVLVDRVRHYQSVAVRGRCKPDFAQ